MTEKHTAAERRLLWSLQEYGQGLLHALERDRSVVARPIKKTAQERQTARLLELIMERADPTKNKKFTPWLAREYSAGRLLLEDLGSAHKTLTLFQSYGPRLEPSQRDIHRYASLAAVWEVVRRFAEQDEVHSNKTRRALERAQAYAESRILRQDSDGFTVAVPMTEFAAKWWGRGTRWCTSAEKGNAFQDYHEEAPLIVIVIPDVGKFQMWVTQEESFLMDASDTQISEELLTEHWVRFLPLFRSAVTINGFALELVPEELRSEDLCRVAMLEYPDALQAVPERLKTREYFHSLVATDGRLLRVIPSRFCTSDLFLAAVQQNGRALFWVPQEQRTYDVCLASVRQNGQALDFVPEGLRTQDLCLAAVQQDGQALYWVWQEHRTQDLCLAAVQQNGLALTFVAKEHLTYEICLAAVQQDGRALESVPEEHRTYELCLAAVQQYGLVLRWVPQQHQTYEICLAAVRQNGRALVEVPQEHRSYDLCLAAVRQDGLLLKHVPLAWRSTEICLSAVAQNGAALEYVPEDIQIDELLRVAVRQNGLALKFVPWAKRGLELCHIAVQSDWTVALDLVPCSHKTQEFYQFLVDAQEPPLEFSDLYEAQALLFGNHRPVYFDNLRLRLRQGADVPAWAPILEAWRTNLYLPSATSVVSDVSVK